MSLAKANNGTAFCAPPTTTIRELLDAFSKFSKQHPELNGQVNDEQTLRALAERYPCAARATAAVGGADVNSAPQLTSVTPIFSQLLSTSIPKGRPGCSSTSVIRPIGTLIAPSLDHLNILVEIH